MAAQLPLVKGEHDPTYRLPDSERQRMRRRFDLDALERLLSHVAPERREEVLRCFRIPEANDTVELWSVGDPALQEMLEEVWAPMWDRVPLGVMEADQSPRPGKRLAAERRKAQPHPHEVVLWMLGAVDAGQLDEASRWVASGNIPAPAVDVLRARFAAGHSPRARSVVGVVPEGDDTTHVLYREHEGGGGAVRVQTVRRTPQGWRVRWDELLAQVPQGPAA